MATTILRLPEVKHRTGLSRSSIYLYIARGTFPPPIHLGARAVGWKEDDIEVWISQRAGDAPNVRLENPATQEG